MELYKVNNKPNEEKINKYDDEECVFYRFQCKDWEIGTQSWGMIYETAEEAVKDGETVLNGKSACSTAYKLWDFAQCFDNDFRVLVVTGEYVEEGHDGEDVIDIEDILEIWDFDEFIKCMISIEEKSE